MTGPPDQDLLLHLQQTRYATAALVLAVLWTIESIAPMFPGRSGRLSHNGANFALAAINALLSFAVAFALLSLTEFSRLHHIGLLHRLTLPDWSAWLLAFLLLDLWQYLWHRLNHRLPFLWRFHAVHHADAELDASSGVRFHTIEIAFSFLARLLLLPVLGLTVPQLLAYEAVSLPIILFHHSNVRIPAKLDRALRWLLVTPRMHYVHHSRRQPETDSNYSSCLSLWDRLFRSFRLRTRPEEIELGLDDWEEHDWRSLTGMLGAPFRRPSGASSNNRRKHREKTGRSNAPRGS